MTAGSQAGAPLLEAQPSSFQEIRDLIAALPDGDEAAVAAVRERDAQLTKPPRALGRLESIAEWLARWSHQGSPRLTHPRVAVFAGNHGVAARGVSAFPAAVTAQMVQNFIAGGAAVNQLCQIADADLRVYELALDSPTEDFTQGPAMSESACVGAMAYGMMAVEPGIDLLCLGEMGIGNSTSAAAICLALYGGEARDWTGPGTGVSGEAYLNKLGVVAEGVARNRSLTMGWNGVDGLQVLRALGGLELAAIAGAVLAARLARVPVLLDGFIATAAAAPLAQLKPGLLDHCLVAHGSREPGHRRLLEKLDKTPLLSLDLALGEASGAALAIPLIRAAVACHQGMATFAAAGVSDKSS